MCSIHQPPSPVKQFPVHQLRIQFWSGAIVTPEEPSGSLEELRRWQRLLLSAPDVASCCIVLLTSEDDEDNSGAHFGHQNPHPAV
jgi:hypothetical protein